MTTPTPDMRGPEQLEAAIATALRAGDIGTSTRLLELLVRVDSERAGAVYHAMAMGTAFASLPDAARRGSLGVDFDGVLHAYTLGWSDGTIYDRSIPGALAGLWALAQLRAVFVFTSRDPHQVASWLLDRRVPAVTEPARCTAPVQFWTDRDLVLVTNRKLPATRYLDDRATTFTGMWPAALRELSDQLVGSGTVPTPRPWLTGRGW